MFYTPPWESKLFTMINQDWRTPALDVLMPLVSSPTVLWTIALAALTFCVLQKKIPVRILFGMALALAISDASCSLVKNSVGRVRPYQSIAGTVYLDEGQWVARPTTQPQTKQHGSSYPSAHAANAAAATMIAFGAIGRKRIWVIPLLIGYSRLYLGKHFPTDVLSGWALGCGIGIVLLPLYPALAAEALRLWKRIRQRRYTSTTAP